MREHFVLLKRTQKKARMLRSFERNGCPTLNYFKPLPNKRRHYPSCADTSITLRFQDWSFSWRGWCKIWVWFGLHAATRGLIMAGMVWRSKKSQRCSQTQAKHNLITRCHKNTKETIFFCFCILVYIIVLQNYASLLCRSRHYKNKINTVYLDHTI